MTTGGLSRQRLDRLQQVTARHIERGAAPGVVTAISRRDEVHVDAIGTLHAGGREPMRPDTIFRISSMTKPITAVAAMILVEECTLRLDDPVDGLLPELADRRVLTRLDAPVTETVPATRPITLRDLLTFRFGFGGLMTPGDVYPVQVAAADVELGEGPPNPSLRPGPDEWMRRLGTLPLMFQPGEQWLYNTAADVLAVLVARASGQPFGSFLRGRIFEPLGMVDTGFSVPAHKTDRFTPSYTTNIDTGELEVFDPPAGGQWNQEPAFHSGGAGLVSTASDYLAFARMLLRHGEHERGRILARPTVDLMTTDHLTPAQRAAGTETNFLDGRGWGFGMSVSVGHDDLGNPIGSYGWDGGLGTSWSNDPTEDMVLVSLTQANWTSPALPDLVRDFNVAAHAAIAD